VFRSRRPLRVFCWCRRLVCACRLCEGNPCLIMMSGRLQLRIRPEGRGVRACGKHQGLERTASKATKLVCDSYCTLEISDAGGMTGLLPSSLVRHECGGVARALQVCSGRCLRYSHRRATARRCCIVRPSSRGWRSIGLDEAFVSSCQCQRCRYSGRCCRRRCSCFCCSEGACLSRAGCRRLWDCWGWRVRVPPYVWVTGYCPEERGW
jgi:hypothetical protein